MTSKRSTKCKCGAAFERDVVIPEARACMSCGKVRVFTREVVYSDNPHVDPTTVEREASIDEDARAWVGRFPRRTRSGDAFMPADSRATTIEALEAMELAAEQADAKSTRERLRAAGLPGAPPMGHLTAALGPFLALNDSLRVEVGAPDDDTVER